MVSVVEPSQPNPKGQPAGLRGDPSTGSTFAKASTYAKATADKTVDKSG